MRGRPFTSLLGFAFALFLSGSALVLMGSSGQNSMQVTVFHAGTPGCLPGSLCPPGRIWTIALDDEMTDSSLRTDLWQPFMPGVCGATGVPTLFMDNSRSLSFGPWQGSTRNYMIWNGFDSGNPNCPQGGGGIITQQYWGTAGYYESKFRPGFGDSAFWSVSGRDNNCQPITFGFEADFFENIGVGGNAGVFWGGYASCVQHIFANPLNVDPTIFHIFSAWIDPPNGITFYLDGVQKLFVQGPVSSFPQPFIFDLEYEGDPTNPLNPAIVEWIRYYTDGGPG